MDSHCWLEAGAAGRGDGRVLLEGLRGAVGHVSSSLL